MHGILIFIKQLTSVWLQSLHNRFVAWTKPDTTSLLLGTLTDLARCKSKLVAENALLRKPLNHPPSIGETGCLYQNGQDVPGSSGEGGSDLETSSVHCQGRRDDATPLASSENGFGCYAAVAVRLLYKGENKNASSRL